MAGPTGGVLGQVRAQAGPFGLPPQVGLTPAPLRPPAPPPPPPKQVGYFVDRLPKVLRKQLGKSTLADQCMDYWITQKRNVNPEHGLVGPVCRCILDVKQVREWEMTKKFKADVPDFAKAEKNVDELIPIVAYVFEHGPAGMIKARFPDQPIPARPDGVQSLPSFDHNDAAWARRVDQWRIGKVEGDGDTVLDLNELSFILGNFNWCWFYTGEAERFYDPNPNSSRDPDIYNPNLIKVTVQQVGIYAQDAYDFVDRAIHEKYAPGGQYLGFWNVDDGAEALRQYKVDRDTPHALRQNYSLCRDAGYYPPMGWCYVTNGVFNQYRETVKDRGCDYYIYSTIAYLPQAFTFFFYLDTKKRSTLGKF